MLEVSDNPNRLTTVSTAEVFWALSQSPSASGLLFAGKPSLQKRGREKQFTNSLNSYLWLWQVTSRNYIFRQPFPLIWLNLVSCILSFYCLFLWLVYFKIFLFRKISSKREILKFPKFWGVSCWLFYPLKKVNSKEVSCKSGESSILPAILRLSIWMKKHFKPADVMHFGLKHCKELLKLFTDT